MYYETFKAPTWQERLRLFHQVGPTEAKLMGHTMENLIISASCEDMSYDLAAGYVHCQLLPEYFPQPSFYNCYTLNINLSSVAPKNVEIQLILFADKFERPQEPLDVYYYPLTK